MENKLKVVLEISKNSRLKYEVDKESGKLALDRVLFGSNVYPQNYGYIEGTLDHDGDPLDVLIISNESLLPGSIIPTRILGAMKMIDSGDRDTKLIGVVDVDVRYKSFQKLADVPEALLNEIKDFFSNYKKLENKEVEVQEFVDLDGAMKILAECRDLFKKSNY
ncbi:inorganic pyrophosphatase [Mycoplasma haemofelis Ohio2]|uniref:Inorganic pyrophosphatase n=1 Tax=Mycoplasma haemofelis (strain Ohio2) TaxID=859194 RepID=F6FIH9_MYCHI|nr:inorganic pyrophosphatase [Mycoplasma haemofelis Ohio2]